MYLSKEEINKYIRALKTRQKLFSNDELAIFVGKKCLRIMKNVANQYAKSATWGNKLPNGYMDAFDYEISYVPR